MNDGLCIEKTKTPFCPPYPRSYAKRVKERVCYDNAASLTTVRGKARPRLAPL